MNYKSFYILCFSFFFSISSGIGQKIDSLSIQLKNSPNDTTKVLLLDQIALKVLYSNPSQALKYANEGLKLAQKIKFKKGESRILNRFGTIYRRTTNYAQSLKAHLAALQISENIKDDEGICKIYNNIGLLYIAQQDYPKSIAYEKKAIAIAQKLNNNELLGSALHNTAIGFEKLNKLDSCQVYLQKAYELEQIHQNDKNKFYTLVYKGQINLKQNKIDQAIADLQSAVPNFKNSNNNRTLSEIYQSLAQAYLEKSKPDSALLLSKMALQLAKSSENIEIIYKASEFLSKFYEKTDLKLSFDYYKTSILAKDKIFSTEKNNQLQNVAILEEIRKQELLNSEIEHKASQKSALLLGLLGAFLVVMAVQYRNNKQKMKANKLLHDQKVAIESQKSQLEISLDKLKTTQKQLVEREKLASLGQLTAGIAHEIQNPLNFVNNFSEINIELIDEILEIAQSKKNDDVELEKELLTDLASNQSKILQHGNRASAIVKAMLEHSRNSDGLRGKVDINGLIEEFLKLSYLSVRSKYKNFTVDYQLKLAPQNPIIEAVSQDIGRVFLNLFNNAFYSVMLKQQEMEKKSLAFQPSVKVVTKIVEDKLLHNKLGYLEIEVIDNGMGIPTAIKDKILQPFFTTKPTGEGTGLGLSISYDIITNAHNGSLEIESVENQGATFIVKLPIH